MIMTHEDVTENLARRLEHQEPVETKTCNQCKLPRPVGELKGNKNGVLTCIKCKKQNAPTIKGSVIEMRRDFEVERELKKFDCDLGGYEI